MLWTLAGAITPVPFTVQAPFGDWSDPRQEDGCEEAAMIMAIHWARNETLTPEKALKEILAISEYEERNYGTSQDSSADDTAERIAKGYFHFTDVAVIQDVRLSDIHAALRSGALVIVPVNGQKLKNPFYKAPGPERHMLLIFGYDSKTHEFIANDAGTKHGKGYRYPGDRVMDALRDYPTGNRKPIPEGKTAMIVIRHKNLAQLGQNGTIY